MKVFLHKKRLALLLFVVLLIVPASALAAASLSAEADAKSIQAGDTVNVTITVSGKNMSVAEGIFTYDPAVLAFSESTDGVSDGFFNLVSAQKGGSNTLSARISFTALGAGSANIEISLEKVLGYDGKEQGSAQASVTVSVAQPQATPTPTPLNYANEGVLAQNVKGAAENMYIWRSLENVTLPSRYQETTLNYHGETVAAATVPDSDAPTLLYLSNAAGSLGGYYIYNQTADTLYAHQTVSSVSKTYILLEPDGMVPLPEGFTETTITIDEKDYTAWKAQDAQGDVYLLYARNSNGEVGYYAYNPADESFQRYAVMPARPAQPTLPPEATAEPVPATPVPEPATPAPEHTGTISVNSTLFYAVCGAAALLFLLMVAFVTLRLVEDARRKRKAAQRKAERERAKARELEQ
ncbi:MAG TPA: cohesin domain-containing protein [Clostridia bacterium]|nr:cohesin domain-containing protein [Clostridia bacterium]